MGQRTRPLDRFAFDRHHRLWHYALQSIWSICRFLVCYSQGQAPCKVALASFLMLKPLPPHYTTPSGGGRLQYCFLVCCFCCFVCYRRIRMVEYVWYRSQVSQARQAVNTFTIVHVWSAAQGKKEWPSDLLRMCWIIQDYYITVLKPFALLMARHPTEHPGLCVFVCYKPLRGASPKTGGSS